MKNLKIIAAVTLITAVTSCSSDDNKNTVVDTEKPTLVINAPTNEQVVHAGDDIHVDVDFTDNVELASYKIDIHFNGDGHSHRSASISEDHIEWAYETTGVLSGKNDNLHIHIDVPENAEEGEYHFGVYAIDKAGNQTVQWIDLDIHNHDDAHDHDHDHD